MLNICYITWFNNVTWVLLGSCMFERIGEDTRENNNNECNGGRDGWSSGIMD